MSKSEEEELPLHEQHQTPKSIAQHMRGYGKDVGKTYRTLKAIWNAPNEELQTGLLHLIIDKLEEIADILSKKPVDMMAGHAAWMFRFHQRAEKAIEDHKKECARVNKFCDVSLLGRDAKQRHDINFMSQDYRHDFATGDRDANFLQGKYYKHSRIIEVEEKVKRLKSVKSISDIEKLDGIGKVKAEKIRAKVSRQSRAGLKKE
jgi:hypothetical protein